MGSVDLGESQPRLIYRSLMWLTIFFLRVYLTVASPILDVQVVFARGQRGGCAWRRACYGVVTAWNNALPSTIADGTRASILNAFHFTSRQLPIWAAPTRAMRVCCLSVRATRSTLQLHRLLAANSPLAMSCSGPALPRLQIPVPGPSQTSDCRTSCFPTDCWCYIFRSVA